ncbi:DUF134 domain-containing protein [Schnuerera sp. xch1]|uniref:DUF134 domain-containing protein n=1 Tax=Schnuerera sp. xch1 TaxID=2874283 RepID=UPI001CBF501F|nr:DUF134 domain-containing protein [Schnuerera sp. xch1]MBZ2175038.1 DUF134 domain-containing protein [Schnuerera sp. xch1]
MARPTKCRRVDFFPNTTCFVPLGKEKRRLKEVELKIEELEAMRLKDIEGLSQQECADRMKVSRQTFQNIIDNARNKVAVALTEGLAINIKGGNFISSYCEIKCESCNTIYRIKNVKDKKECPMCNSNKIHCNNKNRRCNKWCER